MQVSGEKSANQVYLVKAMFRRPSQKRQLAQRIIVSVLALTAILIGVTVTILFILGYRLDSGSGRLEQGALLQFDSNPSGAEIWIDGQNTGVKTGAKRTVLAGTHTFRITHDKYEDWSRTLDIKAGTLTWLDYARLVPKDRSTTDVMSFSSLVAAKASPDRKTYVVLEDTNSPVFKIIDLRSEEVKMTSLTLPNNLYSESNNKEVTHEFRLRQWDQDGRYVIVTHHYQESTEWIVVDTQNVGASHNVTRSLSVSLTDLAFIGTDGKALYGLAQDGVVRKFDLESQTISRALLRNVEQFSIDPNTKIISYVGVDPDNTQQRVAGVYRDGDTAGHVLRRTTSDDMMMIATSLYHGNHYVAIAEGEEVAILKGDYPRSSNDEAALASYATMTLEDRIQWLRFSNAGDFLVAQSDTSFIGFEVEHKRATSAPIASGTTLRWLDDAYVWDDKNGILTMRDFDGSNTSVVMQVGEGFDATLSQNGRFFYAIGKRDNGYALQRVTMIVN